MVSLTVLCYGDAKPDHCFSETLLDPSNYLEAKQHKKSWIAAIGYADCKQGHVYMGREMKCENYSCAFRFGRHFGLAFK